MKLNCLIALSSPRIIQIIKKFHGNLLAAFFDWAEFLWILNQRQKIRRKLKKINFWNCKPLIKFSCSAGRTFLSERFFIIISYFISANSSILPLYNKIKIRVPYLTGIKRLYSSSLESIPSLSLINMIFSEIRTKKFFWLILKTTYERFF
jgi:hypothetical protein